MHKEKYLELVSKIRKAVPDISLTTDIIVGFPGETEEDFQDTLDVVDKCNFDCCIYLYLFQEKRYTCCEDGESGSGGRGKGSF